MIKKPLAGFTLAEVLVSVALIAGILTATMTIVSRVTKIIARVDAKVDQQVVAGTISTTLQDDLRQSLKAYNAPFWIKKGNSSENDQISFYVRKPAYQEVGRNLRDISLVHYFVDKGSLYKGSIGTVFASTPQVDIKKGNLVFSDQANVFLQKEDSQEKEHSFPSKLDPQFINKIFDGVIKFDIRFVQKNITDNRNQGTQGLVKKDDDSLDLNRASAVVLTIATLNSDTFKIVKEMELNNPDIWADLMEPLKSSEDLVETRDTLTEDWSEAVDEMIAGKGRIGSIFRNVKIDQFTFYPN